MPARRMSGLITVLGALASFCAAENTGIVSVEGQHFTLAGRPYYFAGTNCYYLMVFAADPGLRPDVDEVLEDAAALGLTTVRTWAFNDGPSQWNALQLSPGVYQEYVFQGLDYVLYRADQLGLRVILPLVDNWDDYGGMNEYVAWSPTAAQHDEFYTDSACRQWYKNHVAAVLGRVNTFNGRTYRQDPTVLAWELANEPRQQSNSAGNQLQAWIEEMSAYIKSLDPDHLVTTGSEGFYGPTGPNHNPVSWFGSMGVDYVRNHSPATIDFCCFHAFPDQWGLSYNASMMWVRNHGTDTDGLLGKPVIFEEFGKQRPLTTRDTYFQGWYDEIYASAAAGHSLAGSCFWILYHDSYTDYDGYGVYWPADASTGQIISTEAARIKALNPLAGDLDGAGDIDAADFATFTTCLAGPDVTTPPPGCDPMDFAGADLGGDLDVDLADTALFQRAFGSRG